ncbi:MAG: S8 family peptidase, partial [Bacteroidetes bacterium]|nr:S8 family peptidase [Bacteroidota bacterium]
FSSLKVYSQSIFSMQTKAFSAELNKHKESDGRLKTVLPAKLKETYHLKTVNGKEHAHALLFVEGTIDNNQIKSNGIIVNSKIGNVWSIQFPVENLDNLTKIHNIRYIEIGVDVSPLLELEAKDVKADSVWQGQSLPRGYTGKGVIVAIIDWGFDYTHPVFFDTSFTKLRISRAWDQNKTIGNPPAGYSYGAEYVGQNELLAAKHDTDYVFGPGTHGTHVAGIAGGNGGGTVYKGIAHESEIVIISLLRTSPTLVDAFKYITDYAASVNKPFVVNMSFGSHIGPHDGTLLENYAMDLLAGPGRVFVGSAGNNGSNDFHLKAELNTNADTVNTFIEFVNPNQISEPIFGQAVPIWGEAGKSFSASLTVFDKSGNIVVSTPFYHTSLAPSVDTMIYIGNDSVQIKMEGIKSNFINNKPSMLFQVSNHSIYPIALSITGEQGIIHAWNVIRPINRFTNWGRAFFASNPLVSTLPGAIAGDRDYGLGEPAGVGKEVITVGAYRAERVTPNGSIQYGQIASFTSHGPTVDGRVKPDITGPGVGVTSSVNSFVPGGSTAATVTMDGKVFRFESFSGTSMSGPVVTGIVALMLEANHTLTAREAKEIIKATARTDSHTGTITSAGDNIWGWGKINALEAVRASEAMVTSVPLIQSSLNFKIYPNPTNGNLIIQIPDGNEAESLITVFDFSGRQVLSIIMQKGEAQQGKTLN